MKLNYITVGSFQENTFFLSDEETGETIIVDPGGTGREVIKYVKDNNLKPVMIINTHGHPDHTESNETVKKEFGVPVYIHPKDAEVFNVSYDEKLKDGQEIEFAGKKLIIKLTPGHTMGSVCVLCEDEGFMLTGDTLFAGAMGRTDIGGDMDIMMDTLANKFEDILDETVLYPGHGPSTTMGKERKMNQYLRLAKEKARG